MYAPEQRPPQGAAASGKVAGVYPRRWPAQGYSARCVALGGAYRLTTVAPNHALLKQIFDRLLGRPREALDVEQPALPQVSDANLAAPLAALLSRWPVADG